MTKITKMNIPINDIFTTRNEEQVEVGLFKEKLFSDFPNSTTNTFEKIWFSSVEDIPKCKKYNPPPSLKFIKTDEEFCRWKMVVLSLQIEKLFARDESHFLKLHPERYDAVKKAISKGEIDMPYVYFGDDGVPTVQQGRHRIVALYKFGFINVDVMVPKSQREDIKLFYR